MLDKPTCQAGPGLRRAVLCKLVHSNTRSFTIYIVKYVLTVDVVCSDHDIPV